MWEGVKVRAEPSAGRFQSTNAPHPSWKPSLGVVIRGTGSYLPERVLDNEELADLVSDFDSARAGRSLSEWVVDKIGVESRHRAAPGEGTARMATEAARSALEDSGLSGADLDLIVLSTFTSDHRLPQSVSFVQRELESRAKCIQLDAACAGFIDGLTVAMGLMQTMGYRNVLVVHSELFSCIQDPRHFLMQAIFADGAGAVILQSSDDGARGITAIESFTDATNCEWLHAGGGSLSPQTEKSMTNGSYFIDIDNHTIFPFAVDKMSTSLRSVTQRAGRSVADIDWVIAHQTGINITRCIADTVGVDVSRFLMTLHHTGNTSGATIPIALDHFNRQGVLAEGDFVVLPAVGAGMAWGAVSCIWAETRAGHLARAHRIVPVAYEDSPALLTSPSLSNSQSETGALVL